MSAGLAAFASSESRGDDDGPPLSQDERILHLLSRLTPGATPELVASVRSQGIGAWLDRQLRGDLPDAALEERAGRLETVRLSWAEIERQYDERAPKDASEKERAERRRRAMQPMREHLAWVLLRAVYSENAVRETSADFLRNHFCVSVEKGLVKRLVVDWEREVIRKGALGSFGEVLVASAHHPAMLVYLDNNLSRRPPTPAELEKIEARVLRRTGSEERADEAVDLARQRGLNENYARELMELHTLGVDNHYTQADVGEVARALTGWTIRRRADGTWEFWFDRKMHCAGDKRLLGAPLGGDAREEGEEVLARLRRHAGTARFVSRKLCRFLVNDDPDPAMVERVARVFRETDGSLPRVYRAIVQDPGFFARRNYRTKFKRPFEYVVSALRATRADVKSADGIDRALVEMNEAVYRCQDPTGYYDQAEAWRDPGALAARWAFAADLVAGRVPGVTIPDALYAGLPDDPRQWKDALVGRILPVAGIGPATSAEIDRLVEQFVPKKSGKRLDRARGAGFIVAILLGSPEFQKQ